jgi:hypothetical protein
MAILKLFGGQDCLVDDQDFDFLSQWTWRLHRMGYATRGAYKIRFYMHRVIIGAKPGEIVDHINRNKLDNRRSNLRIVDTFEHSRNRTNGYFLNLPDGVTFHPKNSKKFVARFRLKYLGSFPTTTAASIAVQKAKKRNNQ